MILWTNENDSHVAHRLEQPVILDPALSRDVQGRGDLPRLVPVRPGHGAVAALLVPPEHSVIRNGVPLSPGTHAVLHSDSLNYGGRRYWVAAAVEVAVTQFDTAVHGENIFCFFTKARLKDGEPIVVCPGRPGVACSVIYKQAAWEMAINADVKFHCPRCDFDPAAGDWQPPATRVTQLPKLFELARERQLGAAG